MIMKKIVIIFLICAIETVASAQTKKNIETAKLLLKSFETAKYDKIIKDFDKTMKGALSEEKMKDIWSDLNTKCGVFQKYTEITTDKYDVYDIVYLLCIFKNTNLKMKVVFNTDHQIAGLFFVPEVQK